MPWYVWIIIGGVQLLTILWIARLSSKSNAPQQDSTNQQEKIFQLYQQIEDMLDSFEEYVGEMHTQLEDKRTELLELNRQAQVIYMQALEVSRRAQEIPTPVVLPPPAPEILPTPKSITKRDKLIKEEIKSSRLTDRDKEALGRFATKSQKVRFLMSRGLSVDEVARELDIGKGEVILIADLDKTS